MKIELAPSLSDFVAEKIKTGDYVNAAEVIRDSLRRWKEQEEILRADPDWLEQEIQDGIDSPDLHGGKAFWTDLRKELHRERKNGRR